MLVPNDSQVGVRVHVLEPGKPSTLYHRESGQEGFLVIEGECLLIVEGEERRLRPWDYFHCPPGTTHGFVGAGDGPCVIFMAGARAEPWTVRYPVSELAERHGAGARFETTSPHEAYGGFFAPSRRGRPSYWDALPWALS